MVGKLTRGLVHLVVGLTFPFRFPQGTPNTDFVVRELRAVVDGPMAMIR